MTKNGYVKLYRKMTEWEWYKNVNIKTVFLHCLFRANYADQRFEGMTIKKGEFVTSYKKFAEEVGLTVHQVRYALDRLNFTHEVAIKTTNKFTVISVVKWEDFQVEENQNNKQFPTQFPNQVANEWQSNGKQVATIEEYNNNTKEEKENIGGRAPDGASPNGAFSYGKVFSPSMVETNETAEEQAERIRQLREG